MATTTSTGSVAAFFSTEAHASKAISALKQAGFSSSQIGAATAGDGSEVAGSGIPTGNTTGSSTGNTTAGDKAEGVWGKVKNFFDGNETNTHGDVEQYADERSKDNASHEVTSGSHNYDSGDVSHSLTGMSVSNEHSRYFEHLLSSTHSGVVVTVTAPGKEAEAASILEANGGDLGSAASSYDYSAATPAAGQQRIQLLGEVLRVHKDRISRGEVRIRKEVITEQQMVQVPVSREELVIERVAATGQTAVHGAIGQDSEIRIPLSEEQASATKDTLVREEISVGKRSIEGVQSVGDSIRHEELEVEDSTTQTR